MLRKRRINIDIKINLVNWEREWEGNLPEQICIDGSHNAEEQDLKQTLNY